MVSVKLLSNRHLKFVCAIGNSSKLNNQHFVFFFVERKSDLMERLSILQMSFLQGSDKIIYGSEKLELQQVISVIMNISYFEFQLFSFLFRKLFNPFSFFCQLGNF